VAVDFDRWLESQFAASGPFTALIILVKIESATIWPLGSSYATVIGSDLRWAGMRRLLDDSRLSWSGVAIFPAFSEAGGPLTDEGARHRLAEVQKRVIADHAAINEGFFFDHLGRMIRLEEVVPSS
jgi:hypothetical protein